MEQLKDFITNMFSADDWPPRWICGEWSAFHGWLYITSDTAIWLAYFVIPMIIIFLFTSGIIFLFYQFYDFLGHL